jgi:hypothetical protein
MNGMTGNEFAKLIENGDVSVTRDVGTNELHVYLSTDVLVDTTPNSYVGTELRSDETIFQWVLKALESGEVDVSEDDGVVVNLSGALVETQFLDFVE